MIDGGHPKSKEIKEILDDVNKQWKKLYSNAEDKEKKLIQAHDQSELNGNMDEILRKFDLIEAAMKSGQMGNDLPSAKDFIGKHNVWNYQPWYIEYSY